MQDIFGNRVTGYLYNEWAGERCTIVAPPSKGAKTVLAQVDGEPKPRRIPRAALAPVVCPPLLAAILAANS